jgi:hypothetical protein
MLLLRTLLLLLLLLRLHLLHLLEHLGAAADDLPDPHLERKSASVGPALWGGFAVRAPRQFLRHDEAILAALLHSGHRLGEAGESSIHGERLGAAVAFAAIEDGAIVGSQDIIHQRGVIVPDNCAVAGLDCPELEAAFGDDGPQRSRSDPGETDACCDDNQERDPQSDRPPGAAGAMGGFGDGHWVLLVG